MTPDNKGKKNNLQKLNFQKNSSSMWTFLNVPKQALKHIL